MRESHRTDFCNAPAEKHAHDGAHADHCHDDAPEEERNVALRRPEDAKLQERRKPQPPEEHARDEGCRERNHEREPRDEGKCF